MQPSFLYLPEYILANTADLLLGEERYFEKVSKRRKQKSFAETGVQISHRFWAIQTTAVAI
jgi:hypothetical protein